MAPVKDSSAANKAERADLLTSLYAALPTLANDQLKSVLATVEKRDETERDALLARLDAVVPVQFVNGVLNSLLATHENRHDMPVVAESYPVAESSELPKTPWCTTDGLPTKTCYVKIIGDRRTLIKDAYKYKSDSKYKYHKVPVHDNVNLEKPGQVAWLVESMDGFEFQAIFHTEDEAWACASVAEEWIVYKCCVEDPNDSSSHSK